jgi:hypothetical protein
MITFIWSLHCSIYTSEMGENQTTNFMEMSPSWEVTSDAATKNYLMFNGTRSFITVFTRALHWSLSWARSIQSISLHPINLRAILILSTHLRLGLASGLSFWLSHQYRICIPLRPHSCCIAFPSHPPWLDHSNYTWGRVQCMKLNQTTPQSL